MHGKQSFVFMLRNLSFKELKEQFVFLCRHNVLLDQEINRIRKHEGLTDPEHDFLKRAKAMEMVKFAKKHSAFYRQLYKQCDVSGSFENVFASLPVITKTDVRNNRNSICTTIPVLLKHGVTSGTTGSPLTVYRSPGSIIRENAYVWYFRMSHGVNIGDPIVSMRGKLDRHTLSYFNKAENTLYLSIYQLSPSNIRKYAELIESFQPKAICALPSSLYTMVNLLNQENIQMSVPMVFTASSTVYPFQREKIEATLNTKLIDWYGNNERTITLGQCPYGNYHEFPMYSINEFRDGGVVTTSLGNKSFPLIKYYVDDVFHMMEGNCPCGKTKGISAIEGRFEDALVLPDGTLVNGLGIAFQGVNNLRYAQIVQDEVNCIDVNLVVAPSYSKHDEESIAKKLRQRLNDSVTIRFNQVNENDIIKKPSGKFTLIISKLNKDRLPESLRTFGKRPSMLDQET